VFRYSTKSKNSPNSVMESQRNEKKSTHPINDWKKHLKKI
jgi:hypothetical protein